MALPALLISVMKSLEQFEFPLPYYKEIIDILRHAHDLHELLSTKPWMINQNLEEHIIKAASITEEFMKCYTLKIESQGQHDGLPEELMNDGLLEELKDFITSISIAVNDFCDGLRVQQNDGEFRGIVTGLEDYKYSYFVHKVNGVDSKIKEIEDGNKGKIEYILQRVEVFVEKVNNAIPVDVVNKFTEFNKKLKHLPKLVELPELFKSISEEVDSFPS